VAAQVHGDEAIPPPEGGAELRAPGERILGEAMKKEDGLAFGVSGFQHMKPTATTTHDRVILHVGWQPAVARLLVEVGRSIDCWCESEGIAAGSESGEAA
jgi:hypothetical protein